MDPVKKQ